MDRKWIVAYVYEMDGIKCHQCGEPITGGYIRVGRYRFCPIQPEKYGFSARCFSEWVWRLFPEAIAKRMLQSLPTPNVEE